MATIVRIGVNTRLSIDDLQSLSQPDSELSIDSSIWDRLRHRRQLLENHIRTSPEPVYGATTGLGSMKTHQVLPAAVEGFSVRMLRDHAAGYGPWLEPDTSRLMMAIRIIELSQGGSGISTDTLEFLVSCYNQRLAPAVPQFGSIGEADITILAHMARMLLGEGFVWHRGNVTSTRTAFEELGVAPISPKIRDGLALIGGNSLTFSLIIQACQAWARTRPWSTVAMALSWIAWRANTASLRFDVVAPVDNAAGSIAQELVGWIGKTPIHPRHVQDPLSWRCIPQVCGTTDKIFHHVEEDLLNAVHVSRDNPIILDNGDVISNGNFDITGISVELDSLLNALVRSMMLHAQRVAKLLNHYYSDLPPGLALNYGDAGFGLFEFNVSALMAQALDLARPGLSQYGEVAEGVEDYGSMAPTAVQRLLKLLDLWHGLIATELVCAVRAIRLQNLEVDPDLWRLIEGVDRLQSDETKTPYEIIHDVEGWMHSNPSSYL